MMSQHGEHWAEVVSLAANTFGFTVEFWENYSCAETVFTTLNKSYNQSQ